MVRRLALLLLTSIFTGGEGVPRVLDVPITLFGLRTVSKPSAVSQNS